MVILDLCGRNVWHAYATMAGLQWVYSRPTVYSQNEHEPLCCTLKTESTATYVNCLSTAYGVQYTVRHLSHRGPQYAKVKERRVILSPHQQQPKQSVDTSPYAPSTSARSAP